MVRSQIPDYQTILGTEVLRPVYVFCGPEDFLRSDALRILLERVIDPATRDFNFEIFQADETDGAVIYASAVNCPMLSDRRVVLVRRAEKLASEQKELLRYLDQPADSTVLIFDAEKLDARKGLFRKLKQTAVWLEFDTFYPNQIPAWLRRYATAGGMSLDDGGACTLVELTGQSLRALVSELEKAWTYAGGAGTLDRSTILETVGASRDHNVFEWGKSVGFRDSSRAVRIAHAMLNQGESAIYMLVMLARHFNQLYKIRIGQRQKLGDRELAKFAGVHPGFINEMTQQAQSFSPRQIYLAFDAMLEADRTLKSTSRDPLLVLDIMLYRILGRAM